MAARAKTKAPEKQTVSDATSAYAAVPVNPDDIGAELLPILSKGLYTDPFHAVREYVQNAVDAGAKKVRLKLTGNSIVIDDNGGGMSYEALVQARQFGVSTKNSQDHVGFRGIGIYSAYDLCNRLLITTTVAGEPHQSVLLFDFGAMKAQLADDRASGNRTPLHKLIEDNSLFSKEPAARSAAGTNVLMEDVNSFHINRLRDTERLSRYILRNLPVDFDDEFLHREQIKQHLTTHVPGYKAVVIDLDIPPDPRTQIARPAIPHLEEPQLRVIDGVDGKPIAVIWACLYKGADGEKKGKVPDEYEDSRGFVYKVKGFTIGDNTRLQNLFKVGSATLYHWYTGEIYVVDDAVIPNTERDDFEANSAYEQLREKVKDALKDLERHASRFQAREKAAEDFRGATARLGAIEGEIKKDVGDRFEHLSELDQIITRLEKQKAKLAADLKDAAKATLKKAHTLKDAVRKAIEKPTANEKRRKKAAGSATAGSRRKESPRAPTVSKLVEDAGVDIPKQLTALVEIIDEAIEAVLPPGSDIHTSLIGEIEAGLMREYGDAD